jgi:hypothetical protein
MLAVFRCARARMQAQDAVPGIIPVILEVMRTQVLPAGLYGSELWGLLTLPSICTTAFRVDKLYSLQDALEKKRCFILRTWLKLPASTPSICMLHELGCEPLAHSYVRRAARWWNTLVDLDPARHPGQEQQHASPYLAVLQQNISDGLDSRTKNFAGALFSALRVLLGERGLVSSMRRLQQINLDNLEKVLAAKYVDHVQQLKGNVSGAGSMIAYYFRSVGVHQLEERPKWYNFKLPHAVLCRVLRFRLGQHHLRLNTDRWVQPKPNRRDRVCLRCQLGEVDTEQHVLLHCMDPVLRCTRETLLSAIRQEIPAAPMNVEQDLYQVITQLTNVPLRHKCTRFVALCHKVAEQAYNDVGRWQASTMYQRFQDLIRGREEQLEAEYSVSVATFDTGAWPGAELAAANAAMAAHTAAAAEAADSDGEPEVRQPV